MTPACWLRLPLRIRDIESHDLQEIQDAADANYTRLRRPLAAAVIGVALCRDSRFLAPAPRFTLIGRVGE